ncbi:DUF6364 family protein [Spirochaeta lutea]|uniref:Antitoxin n=2 Tax=Spirochaeta lutea TaxID=1480694 RepID=A0A098R1C5_9SPIO|nr:DUF6364 family protein [Spirochaeta lutea]KGE73221.1 hypothetical protein DC28_04895 [Spirochaeta lutea]KGE73446.1 hypothetical protein DC28_03625 [Spirochaeta lutea]KGE73478.1 hypothetical protein DC28_03400 [Spirochaeta lutea]
MSTKLTLRLDEDIIEKAKIYASKNNTSLSSLTEQLYKTLIYKNEEPNISDLNAHITSKYKGIIHTTINDDQIKQKYLMEKHLVD